MFRLLESICFDGSGYPLLDYHQERINRAFREVFNAAHPIILQEVLPDQLTGEGIHKVRVLYNQTQHRIETLPYIKRQISSLQLVTSESIFYNHKYTDRTQLKTLLAQRGKADDILIVKNGLLTDTSYANIALLKNKVWYTPSTPLLPGVRRTKLLADHKLEIATLRSENLKQFEQVSIFNALIDLGELLIPIENILP